MAIITFIIGNGFDLRIGLNTRYTDFYKEYIANKSNDNDLIQHFKKTILQDEELEWSNWSDFEIGMGRQSEFFKGNASDFLTCFDDFVTNFNEYLKNVCASINWSFVNSAIIKEFVDSLICFREYINSSDRNSLAQSVKCAQGGGGEINFLQLNYTDVFDELIQKSSDQFITCFKNPRKVRSYGITTIGKNLHIHGSIDQYPVIGVYDAEQIYDEAIRNDISVSKVFIKSNFLNTIQARNVNEKIPSNLAEDVIRRSTIICIYGSSIGSTDKNWWKIIGDWLKKATSQLIIFDRCGDDDDGISPKQILKREENIENKKNQILEQFYRLAEWQQEDITGNEKKIIVELDSQMFNFKLPIHNNSEILFNSQSENGNTTET